jgi:hypothetical protein
MRYPICSSTSYISPAVRRGSEPSGPRLSRWSDESIDRSEVPIPGDPTGQATGALCVVRTRR